MLLDVIVIVVVVAVVITKTKSLISRFIKFLSFYGRFIIFLIENFANLTFEDGKK